MNKNTGLRWSYATASASGAIERGVCVVRITGVVTPEVGRAIMLDNAQWLRECGAHGQVADYSQAAMAIDSDALLGALVRAHGASTAADTPTGLLVRGEQLALFDSYAGLAARHGIMRAPFIRFESAIGWAAAQAPAVAALRAAAGRAGSHPAAPHTAASSPGRQEPHRTPAQARGRRG